MRTDFVAQEATWVVLIEKNPAELIQVQAGHQFTTGQLVDLFTDEQAAITRATALGWSPPEEESIEE